MELGSITTGTLTLVGAALVYFLTKLWRARSIFVGFRKQGLPMPEHSFATGHLLALASIVPLFPSDALKVYAFGEINRRFAKGGACYLDLWPFAEPFLIITSPHLANQVISPPIALNKPDALRKWTWSISGGISLFDAPAEQWKPLRALFSRGFSANHQMNLVPSMVEETQVHCETLRQHAKTGDMFYLDPTNLRCVLDIIGRTLLNVRLRSQTGPNPLADSLLNQLAWKLSNQELNPLQWLNFVRTMMEWYNGRKMDAYIDTEIAKRFKAFQQNSDLEQEEFKSIIDLALQDYLADPSKVAAKELDNDFKILARRNVRMLLFSGHDSTGSTMTYCRYLLYKNPETLARLRAEHDSILGKNLSKAPSIISENPHILNQLPYTTAVIKETLRLFPPAASIRQGVDGFDLTDEEGNHYPTANCMVYILHSTIQRDDTNFVRVKEFIPERWLVGAEDPLFPNVKGAWRPFEYGPRNCIAQLSVMVGIRAYLALTVREFDIKPAYEEWEALNPKKGPRTVDGERVYQIDEGAAHPADHFPCRVYVRDTK